MKNILLFILSCIYALLTGLYHALYDRKILASQGFDIPVVCVGNLAVGGTGKTPHIDYLISELKKTHQPAIVMRGYKRKSKGVILVNKHDVNTFGDEASFYYQKYQSQIPIVVAEERAEGIAYLLKQKPEVNIILLDDAFQHRKVEPKTKIMLTEYRYPFYKDYLLPFGSLREPRNNAKRADMIVMSKCPNELTKEERLTTIKEIRKYSRANMLVYFSYYEYGNPIHLFKDFRKGLQENLPKKIILITGIAKSIYLREYIAKRYELAKHFEYPDHYDYKPKDIQNIINKYSEGMGFITTEKDGTKLEVFKELSNYPIFVLPIKVCFFDEGITTHI